VHRVLVESAIVCADPSSCVQRMELDCTEWKIDKDNYFGSIVYLIANLNVYAYVMVL